MRSEPAKLFHFARYAVDIGHLGPLTAALALRWVQLPKNASQAYLRSRLSTIRSFAKYLSVYDFQTEIPPNSLLSSGSRRPTPYIYSPQEIADLLSACAELAPPGGLRPQTYRTLFGLIAATGLRISEALKLNRNDVDLAEGILTVRESKFRKSRLVPVHESTQQALRRYADQRNSSLPSALSPSFFLYEKANELNHSTVGWIFGQLRRRLGWEHKNRGRNPRIHDLRHTFVCRRILSWYEQGADVHRFIPILSTYLGHASVTATYWYLTGTTELLALAGEKFERYAESGKGADYES